MYTNGIPNFSEKETNEEKTAFSEVKITNTELKYILCVKWYTVIRPYAVTIKSTNVHS